MDREHHPNSPQPSRSFQKTMLALPPQTRDQLLGCLGSGLGEAQETMQGGPVAPPLSAQACTHRFLRSVAPRKAFLGIAWMAFSLRSL